MSKTEQQNENFLKTNISKFNVKVIYLSVRKAQIRFFASFDMSLSSGKVSEFLWFIILL